MFVGQMLLQLTFSLTSVIEYLLSFSDIHSLSAKHIGYQSSYFIDSEYITSTKIFFRNSNTENLIDRAVNLATRDFGKKKIIVK